jgi:hypothetical protein
MGFQMSFLAEAFVANVALVLLELFMDTFNVCS